MLEKHASVSNPLSACVIGLIGGLFGYSTNIVKNYFVLIKPGDMFSTWLKLSQLKVPDKEGYFFLWILVYHASNCEPIQNPSHPPFHFSKEVIQRRLFWPKRHMSANNNLRTLNGIIYTLRYALLLRFYDIFQVYPDPFQEALFLLYFGLVRATPFSPSDFPNDSIKCLFDISPTSRWRFKKRAVHFIG